MCNSWVAELFQILTADFDSSMLLKIVWNYSLNAWCLKHSLNYHNEGFKRNIIINSNR